MVELDYKQQALREAFGSSNLEVEEDALATCASICEEFSVDAQEFVAKWDAYCMNNQVTGVATLEQMVAFRSKISQEKQQSQNKENRRLSQSMGSAKKHKRLSGAGNTTPVIKRELPKPSTSQSQHGASQNSQLDALYAMKSPEATKHPRSFVTPEGPANKMQRTGRNDLFSPTSIQSPPGNDYEHRTDAGLTVSDFNAHLKPQLSGLLSQQQQEEQTSSMTVKITQPFPDQNVPSKDFTYMYTPLYQRALALDQQLVEYEEAVKEKFGLEQLQAIGDPSPAQVTVVGRIVCEAAEGKLNSSVVQLEGSRRTCGGQRIGLDLSSVANLELFPGKIVALEGVLTDVRGPMVVKRFLDPIPAPMSTLSKQEWTQIHAESESGNHLVRVLTACGPFTSSKDVEFLPLQDLLQLALKEKPDVLLLVGPFIDSTHESFKDGDVRYDDMRVSFEDVFVFKVMTLLDQLLSANDHIQVVMIPSLRDVHHEFVYPQPPFVRQKALEAIQSGSNAKRIHLLSNPSVFAINEVVFGVTALDVVLPLSSNELYRFHKTDQGAAPPPHRLLRLCEQVIDQRSFYPLFPPCNDQTPLDLRFRKHFTLPKTPDVLILPSILNRFCGRVQDAVCINPGQLCKGQAGGTFAAMSILPMPQDKINELKSDDDQLGHLVVERIVVDIKRI